MSRTLLIAIYLLFVSAISKDKFYNEIQLSHSNKVANYTEMKFIDTALSVALDKKDIRNQTIVVNKLSQETKDNFGGNLEAMVVHSNSVFYIFTDEVSHKEAINMLSHEVIHIKQYLDKRLIVIDKQVIWENEHLNHEMIPYEYRPWEIEAFDEQSELSEQVSQELY